MLILILIIGLIILYFAWPMIFPPIQTPTRPVTPTRPITTIPVRPTTPTIITTTPTRPIITIPPNIINVHHTIASRLNWLQTNQYIKPTNINTTYCTMGLFPPKNININTFYKDTPCKCERDEELYEKYKKAMEPITNFKTQIINLSNDVVWQDANSKNCINSIMMQCIENDSFLGTMATEQSKLERMFFTINYMIVYASNYEILKDTSIDNYISKLIVLNNSASFKTRIGNIKSWYILHEFYNFLLNSLQMSTIENLYEA